MRPLRILYHHRTQGRGAEGNHIVSIVSAMRAAGHEVDVLGPPGIDPFDQRETIPVDDKQAKVRGWSSVWRALSLYLPGAVFELAEILYNVPAYFRLRRALRRTRYDVLFERYALYLMAGSWAARRAGCRFALEINEVSGVPDRVRKQHLPRLCAAIERRIFSRCDLAHAVSSYLGDRMVELGVARAHLVVAPNGFDTARIESKEPRSAMRAQFGFERKLVIGFAGWFVPWDRLDFLLSVFTAARRQVPELQLCLVGEGPSARALVAGLAGTTLAGAVTLTGAVARARVCDYIQMFDIGILPHSNLFGSPVVMFEMMGLNVPIVAPRLPPVEDVQSHGRTALLFVPLDVEDCTRQVLELARSSERRRELAAAGYHKLNAEHSWLHTAQHILEALPGDDSHPVQPGPNRQKGTEAA
ncbi:MAG: glycosyltransferase family 4 protein [Steroidobacteraceae bacterium]